MMFKIKQRTKYPVEYSRKCHEKMIPIIESAKNQIANKIAKVNPQFHVNIGTKHQLQYQ